MIKKAKELLSELEKAKPTEQIRIAKKRMKEVIALLEEPAKRKKYLEEKAKRPEGGKK